MTQVLSSPPSTGSSAAAPLRFKIATEAAEFEQIHRLNYQTFVEEIPQHSPNPDGVLVDKFHDENLYFIALRGEQLVGMISVRTRRPFSLDQKLPDLDRHLPPGRTPCEFRLLATAKDQRGGVIFKGLLDLLVRTCLAMGIDFALISGTTRQLRLYRHIGFVPFGPLVGSGDALYQPMYLTLETFQARAKEYAPHLVPLCGPEGLRQMNFLPGPVPLKAAVRKAFESPALSHRSDLFMADFQQARRQLCRLTQAQQVEILTGSGTLANDAIAAHLSHEGGRGLVLCNGEFGRRIIDQARRFELDFEPVQAAWGEAFDAGELRRRIERGPAAQWMWAVHCETSTGVLNDVGLLKELCGQRGMRLCLDCISTIGTVPVDLRGVHLASGVSGKGLGAISGLALIFHDQAITPSAAGRALPRYLDLGYYVAKQGLPFTMPSNLLYALKAAVEALDAPRRFEEIARQSQQLRSRLRAMGHRILAADEQASPAVTTIVPPEGVSAEAIGDRLLRQGILVSYKSDYLLERNWLQVCLMCPHEAADVETLVEAFGGG